MAVLLAVGTAASGVIGLAGARRLTGRCGFRPPGGHAHSVLADLRLAGRDRDFRALVLSYLFTGTTTHLFLAALPFYTRYVFGDGGLTTVFMGGFLAPAVIAGPGWLWLPRRTGKQRGLLLPQGVFIAGSLALLLGGAGPPGTSCGDRSSPSGDGNHQVRALPSERRP